jgi:hypothetical protein
MGLALVKWHSILAASGSIECRSASGRSVQIRLLRDCGGPVCAIISDRFDNLKNVYLSSQTSSMRQPLKMLFTMIVYPLTWGCQQVARRS